jgi:hypothetical protein
MGTSIAGCLNLGIKFNGSGVIDTDGVCGNSNAYVTYDATDNGWYVDVWQAHKDSQWTSSTTVQVYIRADSGVATLKVWASPESFAVTEFASSYSFDAACGCPTVLSCTITITDAGIISIA